MHRYLFRCCAAALLLAAAGSSLAADAITPSGKLPKTTPWDLQKLSETPKFEWVDAAGAVRSLFYESEPYHGKPTRVFAYYATPGTLAGDASRDKNLPAVVLVHGGGGTAFREWAELWAQRGYAAIAMDLAGHRPIEGKNPHQRENRTRLADGGPDQSDNEKFGAIDQAPQEQWPYQAIAAVLRAHSLIRSFDEVDAERTAVTGISWGGYLTCITAGVDNRFKAAVPVYGCGFLHENSAWLDRLARMTHQQRERWIALWDPSQYLPAASMPVLFVNGTNDFAYPLDSYMKSFDAVSGPKKLCVTVNLPHSHPAGWAPEEIGLFIDHHLLGRPALPSVGEPQIENGQVSLAWESPLSLKEAALHVTTDTGPINMRTWRTSPARIDGQRIICDAPPAEATAWFVTVDDERGGTVSSRVAIGGGQ